MHQIEAAAKLLGMSLSGDAKDKQPQLLSDAKLREVQGLLQNVQGASEVKMKSASASTSPTPSIKSISPCPFAEPGTRKREAHKTPLEFLPPRTILPRQQSKRFHPVRFGIKSERKC
jgi:hypothetical protein